MLLKESMTENFSLIGEWSSIDEARAELSGTDYLVVNSMEGLPLTVITKDDLSGDLHGKLTECIPNLPPTIIVGCDLDISSIKEAPINYLLQKKTRGAVLLDKTGLVGVVPVQIMMPFFESASVSTAGPSSWYKRFFKERTIKFNFGAYGDPRWVGGSPIRRMRVATAGTLGGNRVTPVVPRVCKKCGWKDFYAFILPTTDCKNPDTKVQPQPWPHTLA